MRYMNLAKLSAASRSKRTIPVCLLLVAFTFGQHCPVQVSPTPISGALTNVPQNDSCFAPLIHASLNYAWCL